MYVNKVVVGDRVGEVPLLMFVHIGPSKVGIREGTGKTGLILICSAICTLLFMRALLLCCSLYSSTGS